uniref:Uncharacterized protein n=1 Tax=Haptolina brevifila TaxID=156173 RepID=A0A7S2D976_9EUKA|mmetsp:Transcript_348/g.654  ORF Transcript_348/g.654 Transcript_348/m.654 type:complete len:1017 (+) Transcript_348:457-3507(+)
MNDTERRYLERIQAEVEQRLSDAVNNLIEARPADPLAFLASKLLPSGSSTEASLPPASDSGTPKWTLAGWLATQGCVDTLALSLRRAERSISTDELRFFRELGSSMSNADEGRAYMLSMLHRGGALPALADTLWAATETLASARAATGAELQDKFLLDGAKLMNYDKAGLNSFFGGLERKIGVPNPKVRQGMQSEHTQRSDSPHEFSTSNYGVTTTSATEWAFVAEPDASRAWPTEVKLLLSLQEAREAEGQIKPQWPKLQGRSGLLAAGARGRTSLSLSELEERLNTQNAALAAHQQDPLTLDEAIGGRLYTGPLYVKYNAVLRGLDSDVVFFVNQMIALCCAPEVAEEYLGGASLWEEAMGSLPRETALQSLNKYTTTLHVINSAIVKLSKLTVADKVYRGISGRVLPPEFWAPNAFGVMGGVEAAFTSTTREKEVALQYAANEGGAGFVFEIAQGMVDRGADMQWLSQYPHEREILFAPLTGIEVQSTRIDESIMVVEVRPSINLNALTIEQVIGKRCKLVRDWRDNILSEIREGMAGSGFEEVAPEAFELELAKEHVLTHPAEWYNDDGNFRDVVNFMLQAKRTVLQPDERASLIYRHLKEPGVRRSLGGLLRMLTHTEAADDARAVCEMAINLLELLEPREVAPHAPALLEALALLHTSAEAQARTRLICISRLLAWLLKERAISLSVGELQRCGFYEVLYPLYPQVFSPEQLVAAGLPSTVADLRARGHVEDALSVEGFEVKIDALSISDGAFDRKEELARLVSEDQARIAMERSKGTCTFDFIDADFLRGWTGGNLPAHQALRSAHPEAIVRRTISIHDLYRGHLRDSSCVVSHRWEEREEPDSSGVQQAALIEYLRGASGEHIKLVHYDYWCFPQGKRTELEAQDFMWQLSNVNALFLGLSVFILLDSAYQSRFWTLFEAWLAFQEAGPQGLQADALGRRVYIRCIHSATVGFEDKKLRDTISRMTPQQVHELLSRPDIAVTNQADKVMQLAKISKIEEVVREAFSGE